MKLHSMAFFVAFYGVSFLACYSSSDVNADYLELQNGTFLKINTTDGTIETNGSESFRLTVINNVANVSFKGHILLRRGSRVEVFGKNALSITSGGNITVETDISMNCSEEMFNSTCLGGFTSSLLFFETADTSLKLYKGLGPGAQNFTEPYFSTVCLPGSSHGGKGGQVVGIAESGEPYGNLTLLIGGSAGACVGNPGRVAGGGAIEFVAESGTITIGASIVAKAQRNATGQYNCSGGSGGLIRLRGRKVVVRGKLIVDGSDPIGNNDIITGGLGGGAGGVIQIIATEVNLTANSSSLKHGRSTQYDNCEREPENGYFLLKANETTIFNSSVTQFPEKDYIWPARPSSTATSPIVASTSTKLHVTSTEVPPVMSTEKRAQMLLNNTRSIRSSLQAKEQVNATEILEMLNEHKSLTSATVLSEGTTPLCLEMFEEYKIIVSQLDENDLVENFTAASLAAATNCLKEKNHKVWRETREMPSLLETFEQMFVAAAHRVVSPRLNFTLNSEKIAVQVKEVSDEKARDITLPDYSEINGVAWDGMSDSVFIPKQLLHKSPGNFRYLVILYKGVESGLPLEHSSPKGVDEVGSLVMSCSLMVDNQLVPKLSPPAQLTFEISNTLGGEISCSYWNNQKSVWAVDGVTLQESESSSEKRTVCKTDHFTSFAILMQHKEIPLSDEHKLALNIITYVGCGTSIVALVVTLIIFLSIESLSSERHKIHTNLALSLLCAQVLFLSGITETSNKVLCKVIAVFLHYFFMAAFTWMLVEGIHLYLKVVRVFRTENFKMAYYYVFGWCFPSIPVWITVAVKLDSYGNDRSCWLSIEDGAVWAFIGPVIAIIAVNCFVLFMVVKTVVSSASAFKSTDHTHDHVKAGVKGLLVLMPILGVNWLLGLLYVNDDTIIFQYAFSICNAFQGLLIFLLHCVFNNEVRQAFRRQQEKRALSKESDYSQYNASFSVSQTESSKRSKKRGSSNSFDRLKARISLKLMSSSKVVQVQPMSESNETSFQVKRTFQTGTLSNARMGDNQITASSLNCPMEAYEKAPLKHKR